MMPPRYTNMHRTANTGPSSMMAAAVVTAATCAQEEKIQKHITPTNTEHSVQKKKLCEMATQTITITSIFTNLDTNTYNQIPYADQYVPNNNHSEVTDKETLQQQHQHSHNGEDIARTVANNNKINQQQHSTNHMCTSTTDTSSKNGVGSNTTNPLSSTSICTNHIPSSTIATTSTIATATNLHNESTGCIKPSTVLTTSL